MFLQAHISASWEQLLRDSSHGFILKRNVPRLTWSQEQQEAESITQGLCADSGSPVPRWRSQAHPRDEVNCGAATPPAAFPLQAYGFGWCGCVGVLGLQLPAAGTLLFNHRELFKRCEATALATASPFSGKGKENRRFVVRCDEL